MIKTTKAGLSRRSFAKGAATAGVAVLAAPAYIKSARSSSGEVNILMWSDYLPPAFIEAFTGETGIAVNYTGIGSNEEDHQQDEGHQRPGLRHRVAHQ